MEENSRHFFKGKDNLESDKKSIYHPPEWADRLLEWFCSARLQEEIQGDLHELYGKWVARRGKRIADWLYLFNVIFFFRPFVLKRKEYPYRVNYIAMYKNFFIISFRNLVRNKVFSTINILGLAVGMAACLAILQYVHFELSYDRFHKNAANIYRILHIGPNSLAANHPGVGPTLKSKLPEVKEYARVVPQSIFYRKISAWSFNDEHDQVKVFNVEKVLNVDPSFLTMFTFPFVYGNAESAFPNVNSVVISESLSKRFFGSIDPMGKTLLRDGYRPFTVTGVFKDIPENSHIKFEILVSYFMTDAWGGGWDHSWDWKWPEYFTYIQLSPGADPQALEAKFPGLINEYLSNWMDEYGLKVSFTLQPIADIHLKSPRLNKEMELHGSISSVYFLSFIAIFIIIIAWINYINLSSAKSIDRAREVGFRKLLGASRKQLVIQFLSESAIINIGALFLGFIMLVISLPYFNQLTGKNIYTGILNFSLFNEYWFWVSLALILVFGIFVAGIYPAFVLSSFKVVTIFKGTYSGSQSGVLFRKILVGFQFMISIALIAGTLIVIKQVSYMRNKDLGYNKNQVLVVEVPSVTDSTMATRAEYFINELRSNPNVNNFATTSEIPGKWISTLNGVRQEGRDETENIICHYISISSEFIDTYGLKVIAGRNFKEDEISMIGEGKITTVLLNEKAVERLGFENPENSIGRHISFLLGTQYWKAEIVGVLNNYHQRSLRQDYDALMFFSKSLGAAYLCISMNTSGIHESVSFIEKLYKESFPGNQFVYFFQDDYFDLQYAADRQFGRVFGIFSTMAILVASMGLFGLATYMISKRTKEIAIRRVLGASVQGMLILFAKDFIILIFISSIISLPAMYYLGHGWLENYAFKINLDWIIFILPVMILMFISLVTVSFQTIKSSMMNPAETLKYE
jgi:putative ABC transport system permease protein